MKKVVCILVLFCMAGMVFARDFEAELSAELAAAEKSEQKGWGSYALGLGLMIVGLIVMLATPRDPETGGLSTEGILIGGGAAIGGSFIIIYGDWLPSMGESATSTEKARRLQYVIDHPELSYRDKNAIADGMVYIGMSEEHLIISWGKPSDINSSVGSWGVHKQYVYGTYSAYSSPRYVYVENGFVTSWQN